MRMTIIVTGGAGFIGSNFVFHMLKEHPDYRIVCLDKLTYAGNLSTLKSVMENPNFRFVKADICDREASRGEYPGGDTSGLGGLLHAPGAGNLCQRPPLLQGRKHKP